MRQQLETDRAGLPATRGTPEDPPLGRLDPFDDRRSGPRLRQAQARLLGLLHSPLRRTTGVARFGARAKGGAKAAANSRRITTPVGLYNCPSRRRPLLYPVGPSCNWGNANWGTGGSLYLCDLGGTTCYLCNTVPNVARGDYGANAGDTYLVPCWVNQPVSYGQGDALPANSWPTNSSCPMGSFTGVTYLRSEVKMTDITDGTSKTYLVGERYLDPDHYSTGADSADDQCLFVGFDNDNVRSTYVGYGQPVQDQPGTPTRAFSAACTWSGSTWPFATVPSSRSTTRSPRTSTATSATARTARRSTPRRSECLENRPNSPAAIAALTRAPVGGVWRRTPDQSAAEEIEGDSAPEKPTILDASGRKWSN